MFGIHAHARTHTPFTNSQKNLTTPERNLQSSTLAFDSVSPTELYPT